MIELPSWLRKIISKIRCLKCGAEMKASGVIAIGIRKSKQNPSGTAFFFEYKCKKCGIAVNMEMQPMTVEEFVMDMMDQYSGNISDKIEKAYGIKGGPEQEDYEDDEEEDYEDGDYEEDPNDENNYEWEEKCGKGIDRHRYYKKKEKSKISNEDFDTFKSKLNNCVSHDDFMNYIGMSDEDILKYTKDKGKNGS